MGAGGLPPGAPLGPIQVIPPGLVGLLQLKQFGRLPDQLQGSVQPVLEMRDWYFQARRQGELSLWGVVPQTAALVTASGAAVFEFSANIAGGAQVPLGQTWYVEQCAVNAALVAADNVRFTIVTHDSTGHNVVQVAPDYQDTTTARARLATVHADRGFWLGPGDTISLQTLDIVSVPGIAFFLHVKATVLPT